MRRLFRRERVAISERVIDDANLAARCAAEKSRAVRIAGRLSVVECRFASVVVATSGLPERIVDFLEQHTRQTDIIGFTKMERVVMICPDTDLDGAMAMLTRLSRQLETKFRRVELAVLAPDVMSEHRDCVSTRMPAACAGESSVVNFVHCCIQVRSAPERLH